MKKSIFVTTLAALMTCGALVACGGKKAASEPYTVESEDGAYVLKIEASGSATVMAKDSSESIKTGFFKVREENSAVTLSFNDGDELVSVVDTKLHYKFNIDIAEGVSPAFKVHRGQLMKGLESDGVIYNQCYSDDGENLVGMAGAGLLVWNSKIDVKVMKIQCNWSYTYTIENGLSVYVNDEQDKLSDITSVEKNADGNWDITYWLHGCQLPPFGGDMSHGTATLEDAALRSALLLA